jgi:hypothetical protein
MVAVKIVDDRGIESLKVMRLDGTPTQLREGCPMTATPNH